MLAHLTQPSPAASQEAKEPVRKKRGLQFSGLLFLTAFVLFFGAAQKAGAQQTVVQKYGQLRVSGNRILDRTGTAVQLRGMSLYWSQWIPKYYTYNTVKWLRDDWKITVIRAAMGINGNTDGYLVNPTAERNKVIAVVDAAIALGIYVIIDWHDHNAHNSRAQAQAFFSDMAQRYSNSPNVLYEIWNEPLNYSWTGIIKPYHQAVVGSIRQHDPDNIIICGTRNWSQEVDEAAASPVSGSNIAYTLHYYANTRFGLAQQSFYCVKQRRGAFVTEYGTTDASGNGTVNPTASNDWWNFLDQNRISHANWSVADIGESSAALVSGASPDGNWSTSQLKQSGQIVRAEIIANAPDLSGGGTTISNGTYRIIARNSNKALDVSGASTADGANVVQYTTGTGTNQQWTVTNLGSGIYSIRAVHSSKSLDVSGYSTADGGDINQWTYGGGANQRWRIESVSGYFRIVNVNSNKAVEITGASTANNASINQRTYSGATNQQFTFQSVSGARMAAVPTVVKAMKAPANTGVYPNPSSTQFTIRAEGSYSYTITDVAGKILEGGKAAGVKTIGNNLPRGVYVVRVQTATGVEETKVLKN